MNTKRAFPVIEVIVVFFAIVVGLSIYAHHVKSEECKSKDGVYWQSACFKKEMFIK